MNKSNCKRRESEIGSIYGGNIKRIIYSWHLDISGINTNILRQTRQSVNDEKVKECKGDIKKLYQLVSNLMGTVGEDGEGEDDQVLANRFADFFLNKIEKIRADPDGYDTYVPVINDDIDELCRFRMLMEEEVLKSSRIY